MPNTVLQSLILVCPLLFLSLPSAYAETMPLQTTNYTCRMGYCDAQFFIARSKLSECSAAVSSVSVHYVDPAGGDSSGAEKPTAELTVDTIDCCKRLLNGTRVPKVESSNADRWAVEYVNSVCVQ